MPQRRLLGDVNRRRDGLMIDAFMLALDRIPLESAGRFIPMNFMKRKARGVS